MHDSRSCVRGSRACRCRCAICGRGWRRPDAGTGTPTITFTQKGETLTGQYSGQLGEAPIQGTLKGADLTFSFDASVQDTKLHVVYTGKATKDALKGTVVLGEFGEGTFTAHRK